MPNVFCWVVAAALAVPAAGFAETLTGRSSCGEYRIERSGSGPGGAFTAQLCGSRLEVDGTWTGPTHTATRVRVLGLSRPVDLKRVKASPFEPGTIDRFAASFQALRLADTLMKQRGGPAADAFSETLGTAADFVTGRGDVGCTDNLLSPPMIDEESYIDTGTFYVPPFCTVIVSGRVKVDRLKVDGILIRLFGGIEARSLETGLLPDQASLGYVIAVGADVSGAAATALQIATLGNASPGPGFLKGSEASLNGGTVSVEGAALDRLRAAGGGLDSSKPVTAPSIVISAGRVGAPSIEVDQLEVSGGLVDSSGYLGPVKQKVGGTPQQGVLTVRGGAVKAGDLRFDTITARTGSISASTVVASTALLEDGASLEGTASVKVPKVTARKGRLAGGDVEVEEVDATEGSSISGGSYLGPDKAFATQRGVARINASGLSAGGELRFAVVTATGGSVSGGFIDAQELTGSGTTVRVGRQLRARVGRGLVRLGAGALEVRGSPVEGAPGFAGCAAHAPHVDATRLETKGTPVVATHVRVDQLFMRGGKLWPSDEGSVASCLEVARDTDVDGDKAVPFVLAPRLYATLGEAKVGPATALEVTQSGDAFTTGELAYPAEMDEHHSGASFGGFGGTSANLNVNSFDPAELPGARPEVGAVASPLDFREGGIGGRGRDGGRGGGVIRVRAKTLAFDGQARANGGDARLGTGGGSGGTLFLEVDGALSGAGFLQVNGGAGGYGGGGFGSRSGGGGSAGRIRIQCRERGGWRGRTETLGGLGGTMKNPGASDEVIPPWSDRRTHGGPGTVYWKVQDGGDELVVEGALDANGLRGVGYLAGKFPGVQVTLRRAVVATDGLEARALVLEQGAVLLPNNSRVRLDFPPRTAFFEVPAGAARKGLSSAQVIYPSAVVQEDLNERLELRLSGELRVDASSRIDLSGWGGPYREEFLWANSVGNRAGGSHAGLGGVGRSGSPQHTGRPPDALGDPLEPREVGTGGYGGGAFVLDRPLSLLGIGGIGGGALRLEVGGTAKVDGKILVDGSDGMTLFQDYAEQGSGGGAGGSLWLSARALEGKGLLSASGGRGTEHAYYFLFGGGGGGGRVRLDVETRAGWKGTVRVLGGAGASLSAAKAKQLNQAKAGGRSDYVAWSDVRAQGGAGTLLWNVKGEVPVLLVDNGAAKGGVTVVDGDFSAQRVVIARANAVTPGLAAKELSLEKGGILAGADQRFWLHQVGSAQQGWLQAHLWAEPTPRAVELTLGALSIDRASRLEVSGQGDYGREDYDCSRGAYANMAGGSHGGAGGRGHGNSPKDLGCASAAHGTAAQPASFGQGGYGGDVVDGAGWFSPCAAGGSGGGALRLTISGAARIDGTVAADGAPGVDAKRCPAALASGGGAGGSLWLRASTVTGNGKLSAQGGSGGAPSGGGGGGGRIAVEAGRCSFAGLRVDGGRGAGKDGPKHSGAPGTRVGCGKNEPGRP
ncbi:MAG: hypothetical protein IT380_16955 [Myxococcales bacterium]|nr:hypothetical protein [Myxococcales bacterium]